jgi:hypothetical protein
MCCTFHGAPGWSPLAACTQRLACGVVCCFSATYLAYACSVQHYLFLTKDKPPGRRWLTKEQYIQYFLLCYDVLYEDVELTVKERRAALEVRQPWFPLPGF